MRNETETCMRLLMLFLAAGLLCLPAGARAACTLQQRATVPFAASGRQWVVPLSVNGTTAQFVLDTGAERSLVTPEAVHRLGLALDHWVGTTMRGVGGVVEHQNADPRSLTLGGLALQRHTVTHDTSLTVGALPQPAAAQPVDGLLGRDFLSVFDVELDMAAQRLTLYSVHDCSGRFLPWSMRYVAVPAETPMTHALVLPVALDGRRLRALLDTGASVSMLTLSGRIRLGLTPQLLRGDAAGTARGLGRQAPAMQLHRFASLQVGSEILRDPVLWVTPVRVAPIVDLLLGADWVGRQQRVWLSFATAQVFFVPQ
jgi:hypothetical protein